MVKNKKIKIGVDARAMSRTLTGIGRFCQELIMELSEYPVDIILFSPSPVLNISRYSNVSTCEANFKSRLGCLFWSQFILPYWAYKYKIDIFWGTTHRLPEILSKKIIRVVTIHDMVWLKFPKTMRKTSYLLERLLLPRSLKLSDIILSPSYSTANDIVSFDSRLQKKIHVVHLAPFLRDVNSVKSDLNKLNIIKPYILFVGTIEPRKNLHSLIMAFSLIPITIRNKYQLVISGKEGWGDLNIKKILEDYELEKSVIFTGYVEDGLLIELYKNAYLLTLTSFYEGFGLPIIEAQSHGIPVLTSNVSSMPEIAGEGAVYVNPHDLKDIYKNLKKLSSFFFELHTHKNKIVMRTMKYKCS
ncbi:MAG: glycosyltransferase family 4 protein, partial [Legionellales bacterium]|nr:glycosyltransferase family 4 protein [Legionellales bacterium]